MASTASDRSFAALTAAGVLVVVALPFLGNDYVVGVGLTVLMWLALTPSWCVLSRLTGYVSLGHVVFYGLGAYLAGGDMAGYAAMAGDPSRRACWRRRSRPWWAARCCACAGRTS